MPLYEYECTYCGKTFETIVRLDDSDRPQPCPVCEEPGERVMSATPTVSRLNVRVTKNHRARRRIM